MRRSIPCLALGVVLLLSALPAGAEPIDRASASLVAAQRDTQDLQATWTWKRDGKAVAPNSAGLIALALVRTWEARKDDSAAGAARRWGDARIADLAAWREVYDPDVEALVALAKVSGERRYLEAAKQAFARRWGDASPEEALGRLRQVRRSAPALVGYDAALTLRAALAVKEREFAEGLARAVLRDPSLWRADEAGRGWATTSRAAILGAIEGLPADVVGKARARLARRLLSEQGADGSWAMRNTQATAYAVAGLRGIPGAADAVAKGRGWLEKTQLRDGSWAAYNDGLPEPFVGDVVHEVTAEVLLALADTR